MKLQLCLVFLFLCLKGSYSKILSYTSPINGLSYLCGCESRNQFLKNRQIKCNKHHKVIQMEPYGYIMRDSVSSNNDCGKFNFTTCKNLRPEVLDLENRIEVYKKCTFKNSCDINIAGVENGNQRLVNYPFYCHYVNAFNDISVKRDMDPNSPILYFTGENHTGQKIDCDCVATSPTAIRLDIHFIHLKPTSCSKVKFLSRNVQIFGCSTNDTTIIHVWYNVGTEFKLEIRDMEPDKEDVLFFRLRVSRLSVNCTGCTKSKDDLSTTTATSSMDTTARTKQPSINPSTTSRPTTSRPTTGRTTTVRTTTGRPATDQPNSDVPTTDLPNTDIPSTDLSHKDIPTTDQPNTEVPARGRPNTDVPVTTDSATGRSMSAGNTDHSNNDNYPALFGGILAAIIIIIIVGIGIYCYIRKRKKPKNVPNEPIPPVLSSNEYADFHHPIGTDHHYQELMDYQNVTRQNTPTGPESQ